MAVTVAGISGITPQPGQTVTSAAVSRGTQYDLWRLGDYHLVVRSHETARAALMPVGDSSDGHQAREPTPVIVRAKMEYIPKQGLEQVLPFNLESLMRGSAAP